MPDSTTFERRRVLQSIAGFGALSTGIGVGMAKQGTDGTTDTSAMENLVPVPVDVKSSEADYTLTENTVIEVRDGEATGVAEYLAGLLRPSTGYELPIIEGSSTGPDGSISLRLAPDSSDIHSQGYRLQVNADGVQIRASEPAGLFAGVQTLRQLLPPAIEADTEQSAEWTVSGGRIRDYPRFTYRGAHLDVARHFFDVETVKQYIDYLAQYKVNHLHLHLTDDQGWRIEIDSWPNLTDEGADSEVGGGSGGYYTKEEYKEIVQYAQTRFVTVIPEIDMPGHTGAALESYAELNCDGEKRQEDTGTNVGDTSLCLDKEVTYEFIEDVISEVAEMTPGPYLHIGGDEAHTLSDKEYNDFMNCAIPMVIEQGKRPIGWHQILGADPPEQTIGQFWGTSSDAPEVAAAAEAGHELIMSPATDAYLDMKYNEDTELGLDWAGYTPVPDAYDWDPAGYIDGVDESSIMGPETALWSENIRTLSDIEFMLFPRFPGVAELGWSPEAKTDDWDEFKHRLAAQSPRWNVQDINYYQSPQVPWPGE
ncbi:beta-N-acetylhexosaminidase [Halomicroarcula sp. F27]|uniref:beta-N-acetylhexosaminidase n=2 Tax=Haloarcula nitratireducens TaxID=2487749 RepID=A0AAW4PHJ4_9EURY|nr:beta-N-acetylhexosaminidase [Halomicroarcula nitratireducens]